MTSRNRTNPRRRPVNASLPEVAKPADKPIQSAASQPQSGEPAAKPAPAKPAAARPAAKAPATVARATPPAGTKPATAVARPVTPILQDAVASVSDKDKSGKKKKDGAKKQKLVRDSFTLPEADYALFAALKARCLARGVEVKKSELLRAALRQLAGLDDVVLAAVMGEIEKIKTGRPSK